MQPYHVQHVWRLVHGDLIQQLKFCNWLNDDLKLHRCILFSDEAQFTREVVATLATHISSKE
jgi:hypothetical protein